MMPVCRLKCIPSFGISCFRPNPTKVYNCAIVNVLMETTPDTSNTLGELAINKYGYKCIFPKCEK